MEDRNKKLQKNLDNIIAEIKKNSKDEKLSDSLLSELLSVKGQIDHEPAIINIPIKNIDKKFEGETFIMTMMKDGTAVYHVKGGMDIVCRPNLISLNQTISSLIVDGLKYDKMNEEEKKIFSSEMEATSYVLNVPMIAFSDADFMFDIAIKTVNFLKGVYDKEMDEPLKPETLKEDAEFKDAVLAIEKMKEDASESEGQGES